MCFSAAASFSSAALLVPLGIAAVARSWRDHRRELLPLTLMPVGFGLQQGLEGVVWLGLNHGPAAPLLKGGALAYLFFALALWPIWIPYVVLSLWPQQRHWPGRPLLWTLQGAGLVLGIGLWLPLLLQPTRIEPVVLKGSIDYGLTLLLRGVSSIDGASETRCSLDETADACQQRLSSFDTALHCWQRGFMKSASALRRLSAGRRALHSPPEAKDDHFYVARQPREAAHTSE